MGFLAGLFGGGVEAARRLDAGEILLVDVRETGEWRAGHPPKARHVPLTTINRQLDAFARLGKPVAFICRSGHRSGAACRAAQSQGIDALNVRGGVQAWQRAGLPVSRG
jgi:rhodanese-related sulfurtransferase